MSKLRIYTSFITPPIFYTHGRRYYEVPGMEGIKIPSPIELNSTIYLLNKNGDQVQWEVENFNETQNILKVRRWVRSYNPRRANTGHANRNGYWEYDRIEIKKEKNYTYLNFEDVEKGKIRRGEIIQDKFGDEHEVINVDNKTHSIITSRQIVSEIDFVEIEPVLEEKSIRRKPEEVLRRIKDKEDWTSLYQRSRVKTVGKKNVKLNKVTDGKVSYFRSGEERNSRNLFSVMERGFYSKVEIKTKKAGESFKELPYNFTESDLYYDTTEVRLTDSEGKEIVYVLKGRKNVNRYRLNGIWYEKVAIFQEATPKPSKIYEFDLLGAKVEVVIPAVDDSLHKKFLAKANFLLSKTPEKFPDANQRIIFDITGDYHFENIQGTTVPAAATASRNNQGEIRREVQFYAPSLNQPIIVGLKRIFWHETAHTIAYKLWGSAIPEDMWKEAVSLDKTFVSDYSKSNIKEDFAETVEAYIASDGGYYNPLLRKMYKHRFEVLDRIFAE